MSVLLHNNTTMKKAHTVYSQFTADSEQMAMLEAQEKWERDFKNRMDDSWKNGMEKGMEKKALEAARKMFAEGIQADVIVRTTGLPRAVILTIEKEMRSVSTTWEGSTSG